MFFLDFKTTKKVKNPGKSRTRRHQKTKMIEREDEGYLWVRTEKEIPAVKNYKDVRYINSYRLQGRKAGEFLDPQGIDSSENHICVTDPMKNSLTVLHKSVFHMIPEGVEQSRYSGTRVDIKKECYFSSVSDVCVHERCDVMLVTDPLKKCIHCEPIAEDLGKNNVFDTDIFLPKSDTLTGICVTSDGIIAVLDGEKAEVMLCDGRGNIRHTFGGDGMEEGQLCLPQFISWDPLNENYLVSDTANSRVQLYTADGQFLFSFGEPTLISTLGALKYPSGLSTDDHGRIFVADQGLHCVLVYDKNGQFLHEIGKFGSSPGYFNSPKSLTLLQNGDLVVTDSLNYRLQHFG